LSTLSGSSSSACSTHQLLLHSEGCSPHSLDDWSYTYSQEVSQSLNPTSGPKTSNCLHPTEMLPELGESQVSGFLNSSTEKPENCCCDPPTHCSFLASLPPSSTWIMAGQVVLLSLLLSL
jgi:hypothetical protein